jgi:hypothetical protein
VLRLLAGISALVVVSATPANADSSTHTYTFTNSLPIAYEFCFGGPPCSAPREGTPYPSSLTVSGVTGHVVSVTVSLRNVALYSGFAGDMEAELQGPSGASVVMAGAGGNVQPQGSDLTFAGGYPALTDARTSGTYAPTVTGTPAFPSGPPATTSDLSPNVNQDPDGVWELWVADKGTLVDGAIGNGWQLKITTTPYANTAPVSLPVPPITGPARAANPYPAPLAVSGLSGVVDSVRPTLAGLTGQSVDDLDFVLADPAGDASELMADAGGRSMLGAFTTNLGVTFDDAAPGLLPDDTPLVGGVFRPSVFNDGPVAVFPAPAPAGPYPTALSTFAGRDPNGTWDLYGINDEQRTPGSLDRGWDLDITTRPASAVAMAASAIQATRGQPLDVMITRGAPATGPATVAVSTGGGTAVPGADYTPVSTTVAFARGETSKIVTIPILAGAGGTFGVTLSSPTDDAALSDPAAATVTVPGPAVVPPPPPPPGAKPALSSLRIAPASFRAATRGASVAKRATPVGTTLTYRDSQPATTTFTVRHKAAGVKKGRSCVAPPRHPRGHPKRCTRTLTNGTFRHVDVTGANHLRFTGRVRGRALAKGSYALAAVPRNRAGLSGSAASRSFRILAAVKVKAKAK